MSRTSKPHLENFGRPGFGLCGARIRDPMNDAYVPGRDPVQMEICDDCAEYVPRAGAMGRLVDLLTGTGRYKR